MNLIEQLNWRYAAKKMNPAKPDTLIAMSTVPNRQEERKNN
tara:strand:+ start:5556 stop:5678 length:123 start_codon:yes stop_codon:yes gene_type:complete